MVPKNTTGFEYKDCNLCDNEGKVPISLAEDYNLSINEDLINDYE